VTNASNASLLLTQHTHRLSIHTHTTTTTTDVKDETINLSDKELHFTGQSEGKEYSVNLEFFKAVDSAGSTYKVLPRSVHMMLLKKKDDESAQEFWPQLLKDKAMEKNQVKLDWDRYVDPEDEAEGFDMSNLEGGSGMGGMGGGGGGGGMGMPPGMDMEALMKQMGGMGGMDGGMGGMGGMDGPDFDDDDENDEDDLEDLEETN
jgi:cytosolic prostaglandin-E synthase